MHSSLVRLVPLFFLSAGTVMGQSQLCQQQMKEMNGCVKYEAEQFGMDGDLPPLIQVTIHQCFATAGCAVPIFPIDPLSDFPPAAKMAFDRFQSNDFMTSGQKKCVEDSKRLEILAKLQQCTTTGLQSLPDWENDKLEDKTKRLKNLLTLEKAVRKCPQGGNTLDTCINNALAMQGEEFCDKVNSCASDRVNNNCKTIVLDTQDEVCGCAERLGKSEKGGRFGPEPSDWRRDRRPTDRFGSNFPSSRTKVPSEQTRNRGDQTRNTGDQNGNNQGSQSGLLNFFRSLGGFGNSNNNRGGRVKRQFDFGEIFGQIFGGTGGDFNIESLLQGFLRMIDPIGIFSGAFGDGMAPDMNVGGFGALAGGGEDDANGGQSPQPSFGRKLGISGVDGQTDGRRGGGRMGRIKEVLANCGVNADDLMNERKKKLMDSCRCRTDAANSVLQECLKRCREEVKPYRDIIHAARLRQRQPLLCRMMTCNY